MEIVRREIRTYDGETIRLCCKRTVSDAEAGEVSRFVMGWLKTMAKQQSSREESYQPYAEYRGIAESRVIIISSYWVPSEWFEALADAIESQFPFVSRFEVGIDFDPFIRDDKAFISVPRKEIELEDGTRVVVEPFRIAKYPVSVEQYKRFVAETGHVTQAELRSDENTFRNPPEAAMIPENKRGSLAAS
jgi:hypothetical protein